MFLTLTPAQELENLHGGNGPEAEVVLEQVMEGAHWNAGGVPA